MEIIAYCLLFIVVFVLVILTSIIRSLFKRVWELEAQNLTLISKLRMLDASQKGDYPTARFAYQALKLDTPLATSAGALPDEELDKELPETNDANTDASFTQIG